MLAARPVVWESNSTSCRRSGASVTDSLAAVEAAVRVGHAKLRTHARTARELPRDLHLGGAQRDPGHARVQVARQQIPLVRVQPVQQRVGVHPARVGLHAHGLP